MAPRAYWKGYLKLSLVSCPIALFPWPAPGSEDTKFGVTMRPEVSHAEAEVYARVQA